MSPNIDSTEKKDKEKRPVSPHNVKNANTAKTKTSVLRKLTSDFRPVSEISGNLFKNLCQKKDLMLLISLKRIFVKFTC